MWRAADRGDIVLAWLTKVVVVMSLLGVLGFDGMSLLQARMNVGDTADQAARGARDAWDETKNAEFVFTTAQNIAAESGGTIPDEGVVIESDGSVSVVVNKRAETFVLRHLGERIRSIEKVTGHGQAGPLT